MYLGSLIDPNTIQLRRQGRKKEGDIALGVITMVLVVRRDQIVLLRRKALRGKNT